MKTLTMTGIDHFENETFEEHADIFDAATAVPVYGQAYGAVRSIGGGIASIFGGKKEDTSDVGFKNYKNQAGQLPFYPTKDEMIKAAQSGFPDKAEPAAIQATYNPQDGTWKRGDWNFAVSSTNPIIAKAFKGATEGGTLTSTVQAAIPTSSQVVQQPAATAVHVSNMPSGSTPGASMVQSTVAPTGTGTVSNQSNTPAGAASLVSQVQGMLPSGGQGSTTTYVVMGVVLVIVIVVIFIASKK